MIKVENGKILEYSLPKTGTLKNGYSVIGYDTLPLETLKKEGWLPLVISEINYDKEKQYIYEYEYEIKEDEVVATPMLARYADDSDFEKKMIKNISDIQLEIMMLKMGDK